MHNASRTRDKKPVKGEARLIRRQETGNKTVNCQLSTVNGFSLIELLVVISILGLLAGLGIASFSSFNRATRLSNAASQLRSDIRLAQSRALSGDKGFENANKCDNDNLHILAGWFIRLAEAPAFFGPPSLSDQYSITGVCLFLNLVTRNIQVESTFGEKTYYLPKGTGICDVSSTGVNDSANVLFRPLAASAYIFQGALPAFFGPFTPPFFMTGTADTFSLSPATSALTVKLTRENVACGSAGTYQVIIEQSGEVYDQKI